MRFSARRLEWSRVTTSEADVRAAFESGQSAVGTWLDGLGAGKADKVAAWATAYATNVNTDDFDRVTEQVVQKFSPYEKQPPEVLSVLPDL
ncbi:hypothetical protein G7075_00390 [Phycicoccus sp. HDW14]|uniref:hypothetical protein n=1 Tax=Phycicoccus sp. HDW14 TaxID=2714941 RepID=UPI00140BB934|nr:hypothetical protein [Phycicoccus sp. HDW14]QIM19948.1 hypothetical protein G7075_00390 [Phycicoccus sp. HDW14]